MELHIWGQRQEVMMKNRKVVSAFFQVYENDCLRDYLEHMAQKGWKLSSVGSIFLHFEACKPHRIRYCVEIMEKPSAYASNQTKERKTYREFCEDAGWDYVGSTGYLHIFCTEDKEAVLVETDSAERYERICRAFMSSNWLFGVLFGIILLQNLYSCYLRKTFFCLNGWTCFLLITVFGWNIGGFYLWRKQAEKSLKESGNLPCISWNFVQLKNNLAIIFTFLLCTVPFVYSIRQSKSILMIYGVMLTYTVLLAVIFTKLLYWLREKQAFRTSTNIVIYWGIGIMIAMFSCIVTVIAIIAVWG